MYASAGRLPRAVSAIPDALPDMRKTTSSGYPVMRGMGNVSISTGDQMTTTASRGAALHRRTSETASIRPYFDVMTHASYTANTRVRPANALPLRQYGSRAWFVASRLTTAVKESGVGDDRDNAQDDAYAVRRAQHDKQFHELPLAGAAAYWRRIEGADGAERAPLEVLTRCFRERTAAGVRQDADRIFNAIVLRVQAKTRQWASSIARQARSGMRSQLQEDLEQECYLELWQELEDTSPTYLLESFATAFTRIRQHVAHDVMVRAGEWRRFGVERPSRVPRQQTDSLYAQTADEDETQLLDQIGDPSAQEAFELADLSDLFELIRNLPQDERTLLYDRFWDGRSQAETAAKLGITDRMVRYRLKALLHELGVRYHGGEEEHHD